MEIDSNPFFKSTITPWYDSDLLCWGMMIFMISILVFSVIGVKTALDTPTYTPHVWVPYLLIISSGGAFMSTVFRLIRRRRKG